MDTNTLIIQNKINARVDLVSRASDAVLGRRPVIGVNLPTGTTLLCAAESVAVLAVPTQPCVSSGAGPDGLHVARFAAARCRGLITGADFAAVIEAAGVFTNGTVVYDQTLAGRA